VITTYTYDADNLRVTKAEQSSTTFSIRGVGGELLTEVTIAGSAPPKFRDYIYAGSRMIAAVSR
jgi:hypothetical protein